MENIIAIKHKSEEKANIAFMDFMRLTENELNGRVRNDSSSIKNLSAKQIEVYSLEIMKEIAPATPFRPEEIILVSGQSFPDIVAERFYGVEVKSTSKNHWTSTGSSIVESTRISEVENIYMLFAKMGGKYPEFRCKPYQDCLSDIAVTHSPRYMINMDLSPSETIFSKMGIEYNELRHAPDIIEKVRNYYRNQSPNKEEMPWWLGGTSKMNITFFNNLSEYRKRELKIKAYALFGPDIISNNQFKYKKVSLWLCSYYSLLCNNVRDTFSAGGQCYSVRGVSLGYAIPKSVANMLELLPEIREVLRNPDSSLWDAIKDFWGFDYTHNLLYEFWLKAIADSINKFHPEIDIDNLIERFS